MGQNVQNPQNPFQVNYKDVMAVIDFARQMAQKYPKFTQYVVKYPDRDNFNITMQLQKSLNKGAKLIWSSDGQIE